MAGPSDAKRVILELEPSADSIRGSLACEDTAVRDFHGWLELTALLDRIRPRTGEVAGAHDFDSLSS
ncbi:MAG: hypothetical protein ACRDWT_12340 [Jatrophihabitantaceae bacterium]